MFRKLLCRSSSQEEATVATQSCITALRSINSHVNIQECVPDIMEGCPVGGHYLTTCYLIANRAARNCRFVFGLQIMLQVQPL
jgi:hypothetical protein